VNEPKRFTRGLVAAAFLIVLALVPGCGAEVPLADDRIELSVGVETTHFRVIGSTTDDIFNSLRLSSLPTTEGSKAVGLTTSNLTYDWEPVERRGGKCAIGSMSLLFSLRMILPEHAQASLLTPTLSGRWANFARDVQAHEQRHVDIYAEGAEAMRAAMLAIPAQSSCEGLEREIDRVWTGERLRINGLQERFHLEDGARLDAAQAPLLARINTERAKIEGLKVEVDRLDRQISAYDSPGDSYVRRIDSLKAEMRAIETAHPMGAPASVVSHYNSLVSRHNDLVRDYNAMLGAVDRLIDARNALAGQHDGLIAALEPLIEDLKWLQ
jgi:predicted secreted Zn-dependent protease